MVPIYATVSFASYLFWVRCLDYYELPDYLSAFARTTLRHYSYFVIAMNQRC